MSALLSLVQRAAAITKPYNAQDALLLIKALSALRLTRPEVRLICERASFSLASSPAEVPVAVLVDAVNHLCTLQSARFPVVQHVLLKRFCELPCKDGVHGSRSLTPTLSCAANPRIAQKAALVLAKLGRSAGLAEATEHVLRLTHSLLAENPDDIGLHIAYVALYVNSSRYTSQQQWWATTAPLKTSAQTLIRSLTNLMRDRQVLTRASGNVAWQLLHLLLVIPPSTQWAVSLQGRKEDLLQECKDFDICAAFGALANKVSPGAYVQFVYSFGADVCRLDLQRTVALLTPLARTQNEAAGTALHTRKRLNVYDGTKLASALAAMLSALAIHPSRSAPFPVLNKTHERPPAGQVPSATPHTFVDEQKVWRISVDLCFTILSDLVRSEQARLLSTSANESSLIDVAVSPDQFLVAALLDSYARGYAVLLEPVEVPRGRRSAAPSIPLLSVSVSALLELVPLLSETPATMISWMLRSLVSLQRRGKNVDRVQLERSASFLFRRYLGLSSKRRCLRTNVEMLYAYARLVGSNGDTDDSEWGFFTGPTQTVPEKSAFHWLPPFGALDPILREVASGLRASTSVAPDGSPTADADMLLAAILHLYPSTVLVDAAAHDVAKGALEVPPLLDELQTALAEYFSASAANAPSGELEAVVTLRAVRLHLVAARVFSPQFALCRSAAALAKAAERTTQRMMTTAPVPSSSSMLRALAMLERAQRTGAATSPSPGIPSSQLLSHLCYRYQEYIGATTQACEERARVSEVVRVLWRARQVGVRLFFTGVADPDSLINVVDIFSVSDVIPPQLRFPGSLCCLQVLTCCAAADLLQLIAESQLINPQLVQLQPHAVSHLRMALLEQLTTTVDVECVIRLVQSNATPAVSQVMFPRKDDLHRLMRCVAASIFCLLHSAPDGASEAVAERCHCDESREQAGRLLHALVESQLFMRIPEIASGVEDCGLRQGMLQLAQYLEDRARQVDVIAVMKMRLLCGGAL
ncbi:hypothetical protein JKF63_00797 [Porcisia hertigi]|uniref:Uncharacterized protein n=1 Tax=Porcisia hertigi TaxID=2761500 RepID=A0A836I8W4_9TRYP|nr:hypothetical protein JKF63_00797 [Porcisia hertigi]